jgi:DNA-binding transcriptional regulator PaaX
LKLNKWLLLVYKIPREPSVHRVSIWRKLKQLGALLLQDALWVLPANNQTREQFQWLAAEIVELGGEATVFMSELDIPGRQAELAQRFATRIDEEYKEIIAALRRRNPDLASIGRRYQQALSQDYFHSRLGDKARKLLLSKGEKSP